MTYSSQYVHPTWKRRKAEYQSSVTPLMRQALRFMIVGALLCLVGLWLFGCGPNKVQGASSSSLQQSSSGGGQQRSEVTVEQTAATTQQSAAYAEITVNAPGLATIEIRADRFGAASTQPAIVERRIIATTQPTVTTTAAVSTTGPSATSWDALPKLIGDKVDWEAVKKDWGWIPMVAGIVLLIGGGALIAQTPLKKAGGVVAGIGGLLMLWEKLSGPLAVLVIVALVGVLLYWAAKYLTDTLSWGKTANSVAKLAKEGKTEEAFAVLRASDPQADQAFAQRAGK